MKNVHLLVHSQGVSVSIFLDYFLYKRITTDKKINIGIGDLTDQTKKI